jgi:serine/threonine protein kinase/Flp pilus assembly protein TadD
MTPPSQTELDAIIEAYEAAQAERGEADLAAFLPGPSAPHYRDALRELVRVDLEYHWRRGRPRRLEDYQARFPDLFRDTEGLQAIAFEEFRLRQQAGEDPTPSEYGRRFGVLPASLASGAALARRGDGNGHATIRLETGESAAYRRASLTLKNGPVQSASLAAAGRAYREHVRGQGGKAGTVDTWCASYAGGKEHAQLFRDLHQSDPEAAGRLADALSSMPVAGDEFLGFRLVTELGRGAFARVFLAEQGELANRPVVLKISSDAVGESQKLAQLQHTNIVPIYSVHRAGSFQAVCMPYFGATTLQDVYTNLESLPELPDSGKGLVSTLNARRNTTVPNSGTRSGKPKKSAAPATAAAPAADVTLPAPAEPPGTLKVLEQFTYAHAVLWLGARLADGLAHAHERGILHRDLKPANILLTDEGQPMLLDFNLSEDAKARDSAAGALIGGTLPYMAPEHLDAFRGADRPVDARSDLYSLGIILFELLTRRPPFAGPRGPLNEAIPRMIAERLEAPPQLRPWNKAVSPAVESIVRHCLEPDPAQRYQTAQELREDLERHLDNRPLKFAPDPSPWQRVQKWRRRHPRVTAAVAAGTLVLAGVLTTGLGVQAYRAAQQRNAQALYATFRPEQLTAETMLNTQRHDPLLTREEAIQACRACLGRYGVVDDPAWYERPKVRYLPAPDRDRLRADVGVLLLRLAQTEADEAAQRVGPAERDEQFRHALVLNTRAEECFADAGAPASLWRQRADLAERLGRAAEAKALLLKADNAPPRSVRDRYLRAVELVTQDDYRQAIPLLRDATREDPRYYGAWFVLGYCHYALGQYPDADACYGVCVVLRPDDYWPYLRRGIARIRHRDFAEALADLSEAVRLRPDRADLYMNRALAYEGLRAHAKAVADLTRALDLGAPYTRIYFMRAWNRRRLGDKDGADRDFAEAMKRQPTDELSWAERGYQRLQKGDKDGALADFGEALKKNPRSQLALQNKAHILAEQGRIDEALHLLDREVALYPDHPHARSGRGVLLARRGRNAEARQDAEAALRVDDRPSTLYQVAGIYALTSRQEPGDRAKALRLLKAALRKGFGLDLLDRDDDLDPVRALPEFRRLAEASRQFREAVAPPRP